MKLQAYREGNTAVALYEVGGSVYEQECSLKLDGLSIDEIGCTSGRSLGCKLIYHIPFLSSNRTLKVSMHNSM